MDTSPGSEMARIRACTKPLLRGSGSRKTRVNRWWAVYLLRRSPSHSEAAYGRNRHAGHADIVAEQIQAATTPTNQKPQRRRHRYRPPMVLKVTYWCSFGVPLAERPCEDRSGDRRGLDAAIRQSNGLLLVTLGIMRLGLLHTPCRDTRELWSDEVSRAFRRAVNCRH